MNKMFVVLQGKGGLEVDRHELREYDGGESIRDQVITWLYNEHVNLQEGDVIKIVRETVDS